MAPAPSPKLVDYCQSRAATLLAMLCETAATIASRCGFQTLLTLISERGGTPLYIPARQDDAHRTRLAAIVGAEYARTLIAIYGGTYITVPTKKGTLARINRLRAIEFAAAGWTRREIAEELGVSLRTVDLMKSAAYWKDGAGIIRAARESSQRLQPTE